jgi:uncharacterized protein YjbI with pentapeptide repeats
MANEEHFRLFLQGVPCWNQWRKNHLALRPDLRDADLSRANTSGTPVNKVVLTGLGLSEQDVLRPNLCKANLNRTDLRRANLRRVDLTGADLNEADLRRANLEDATLRGATLRKANLGEANFRRADLTGADLSGADLLQTNLAACSLFKAVLTGAALSGASLVETNLSAATLTGVSFLGAQLIRTNLVDADLSGSSIYGVSVWDLKLNDKTKQENLIITPPGVPVITVDNIKVAQFVYLLLNNKEVRDVIDTITSKAVLILGRFTPERKDVLDALRTALRKRGFVPIIFDFDRPTNKDFSETIMTLAGMSCFIIADITNPKSSPLELQATVPNYMIPFVPIIQQGEEPFAMFRDLHNKYEWVLDPLIYPSSATLVAKLKNAIVLPALERRRQLAVKRAQELPIKNVSDYPEDDEL